ncbi:MAG: hypothetical protein AAFQ82_26030 [Myxococcota bacterium]
MARLLTSLLHVIWLDALIFFAVSGPTVAFAAERIRAIDEPEVRGARFAYETVAMVYGLSAAFALLYVPLTYFLGGYPLGATSVLIVPLVTISAWYGFMTRRYRTHPVPVLILTLAVAMVHATVRTAVLAGV